MKRLFLLLYFCASALGATAQISGGLKAGLNFANFKLDGDGKSFSFHGRTGFHAGGYLTLNVSDNFGIQPELLFSRKGAESVGDPQSLNYLSVPVLAKFQPIELINLHAGPQFGLLLSAEFDDLDVKEAYKDLDFGLAFGGGVDLPFGLNFTLRYILGVANIAENAGTDLKVRSRTLQLSAGFKLFGNN